MPILVIASIAIQVALVVHCIRTDRTQPWLYVLLFLPGVGGIAYFLIEILPEIARNRRARQIVADVRTIVDPDREYRERKQRAEQSGTAAAKSALAEECSRKGMHDDAVALFRSALTGPHADDPGLLLRFAGVLMEKGDPAEVEKTLDHLRVKNPDYQSSEGHLLYARALEGQSRTEDARREYEAVTAYFAGYEAKVRYGLFLTKLGEVTRAREIFEGVVTAFKKQPRHAQDMNRDWYLVAKANLDG